jgi:predicted tellurium resistance membrane protein TerC
VDADTAVVAPTGAWGDDCARPAAKSGVAETFGKHALAMTAAVAFAILGLVAGCALVTRLAKALTTLALAMSAAFISIAFWAYSHV